MCVGILKHPNIHNLKEVIEMASIGDCADEHFRTKNLWRANLPPEHFDKYDERQTDAACQLLEWFGSVYLSALFLRYAIALFLSHRFLVSALFDGTNVSNSNGEAEIWNSVVHVCAHMYTCCAYTDNMTPPQRGVFIFKCWETAEGSARAKSRSSLSLFMSATLEQWPAMCRLSTNAEAGGYSELEKTAAR